MTQLNKLTDWYATLSIGTLPDIRQLYASNASFKDPFNDVVGVDAIQKIFVHMFATTEQPRFIFGETIQQEKQAFLTWEFIFSLNRQEYTVRGGTHLQFDDFGLVIMHRDYWDAAEELWQKLPIIGILVRWLRGKFSVK